MEKVSKYVKKEFDMDVKYIDIVTNSAPNKPT